MKYDFQNGSIYYIETYTEKKPGSRWRISVLFGKGEDIELVFDFLYTT